MRITKKIRDEVLSKIAGEDASKIIDFIKDKKETSEFIIAEKTKIEIHRTRMILYKLFEANVAAFVRRKDKIKGWYICYWDFLSKNIKHTYVKLKKEKLEKLQSRLEQEQNHQFFMCKNACARMNFEKAVDFEFKCPECGELMNQQDNSRTIEFLSDSIASLKKDIANS
ncbi:hypothetical protein GOV08_01940 [Candidatus Woesearchaeota archaeon]|nr:hypothetical protein [Candidatus Woesearchaeota archaeon]